MQKILRRWLMSSTIRTAHRIGRGSPLRRLPRGAVLAVYVALQIIVATAFADDRNPLAHDPNAAKAGEYEFRINCALCHGLGARGGGRGPDLTRAQKKHTHNDAEMFQVISNGIPGTAMPANGTNGQGVGMTDTEIWQIIAYIRSQEVKAPAKPRSEERRVGKSVDLGGRRIMKKKKKRERREEESK